MKLLNRESMRLNILVGQTLTVKCFVQIIWGMRERIQHHQVNSLGYKFNFLPSSSSSVVQGSNSEGVWGLERMAGEGG